MKRIASVYSLLASVSIIFLLTSCKNEPYFAGGNKFHMETLAPEGVKVVGTLWYHNTENEQGDHMSESLEVIIEGHEPLPVNYGRDHVIRVGANLRYDVPVVFYVPTDYITESVEEATLLANKKLNREIKFRMKGHGTIIIGDTPVQMPVDFEESLMVWDDL